MKKVNTYIRYETENGFIFINTLPYALKKLGYKIENNIYTVHDENDRVVYLKMNPDAEFITFPQTKQVYDLAADPVFMQEVQKKIQGMNFQTLLNNEYKIEEKQPSIVFYPDEVFLELEWDFMGGEEENSEIEFVTITGGSDFSEFKPV